MKRWLPPMVLALSLLCGCGSSLWSNYRPVESLQPVQTVGFDVEDGALRITVSALRGHEPGGTMLLSGGGQTVAAAVEDLRRQPTRQELFFPHTRYALLGTAAAEQALEDILLWFTGSGRARLELPVFLVENSTAGGLMLSAGEGEYEITRALEALEQADREPPTLLDLSRQLRRTGAALCPAVTAGALDRHMPAAGDDVLTALDAGYAVLRPGAPAVFLSQQESLGAALLLSLADPVTVFLPRGSLTVSPEALSCRWEENRLTVTLDYTARPEHSLSPPEPGLEETVNQQLREAIAAALEQAKALNADFLELTENGAIPPEPVWEIRIRGTLLPPAGREAQA